MSEKLDKLRASLEKERERRIKINTRIESLERRIQEAEAAEVNEMVRTAKVTPEQLAALLRQSATSTPTPAALSAVGATFNKEDDCVNQPLGHSDKELFQFISGRNCRNVSCYRNSLSPKRKKIIKFLFKRISRWTKHFRNYYRLTLIFHP